MTKEIEEFTDRMVRNEVFACVSSIVADLANGFGSLGYTERQTMRDRPAEGALSLMEEAAELSYAVEDYEEAATQAGWEKKTFGRDKVVKWWNPANDDGSRYCDTESSIRALCEDHDLDPYQWEVFEHWIVSGWLGDELTKRGERVGPLGNLTVWGRTTTGQGIAQDSVIRQIAADCLADK